MSTRCVNTDSQTARTSSFPAAQMLPADSPSRSLTDRFHQVYTMKRAPDVAEEIAHPL